MQMLAPRASVSPSHTRRRPRTATTPCTSRWGERDRWRWSGRACVVAGPAHARSREQPGRGRWRPPRAPSQVLGPVSDRSLASQVRGAVPSQSPSRCARHRFIFLRRCVRPRAHPRLGAPPRAGIVPRAVNFLQRGGRRRCRRRRVRGRRRGARLKCSRRSIRACLSITTSSRRRLPRLPAQRPCASPPAPQTGERGLGACSAEK